MFKLFMLTLLLSVSVNAQSLGGNDLVIDPSNSIIFRDEVNSQSMADLTSELLNMHLKRKNPNSPIYLVIDSPGGSIAAGQDFIDFASTIPNVVTVNQFAASMAAGIIQALPGRRLITASSVLMFHRARGGVEGQFEDGELESRLLFYKAFVLSMEKVNAARLQLSLADYKAAVKDELWLYGEQILARKGADKQVTLKCSKAALTTSKLKRSIINMGFMSMELSLKVSNCPLLRQPEYMGEPDQKARNIFQSKVIDRRGTVNLN